MRRLLRVDNSCNPSAGCIVLAAPFRSRTESQTDQNCKLKRFAKRHFNERHRVSGSLSLSTEYDVGTPPAHHLRHPRSLHIPGVALCSFSRFPAGSTRIRIRLSRRSDMPTMRRPDERCCSMRSGRTGESQKHGTGWCLKRMLCSQLSFDRDRDPSRSSQSGEVSNPRP